MEPMQVEQDTYETNQFEVTSSTIERSGYAMNSFLRKIKERNKDLVIGYVRNSYSYIPSDIISYIMFYLFLIIEQWDISHKSIIYGDFAIAKDRKTIHKYSSTKWENVFDIASISMNTGIHKWTIKLTAPPGFSRWVLFGIVPSRIVDGYSNKRNNKRRSQWIINSYFRGYALHLGNGVFFENDYARTQSEEETGGGIVYIPRSQLNHVGDDEGVFTMIFDSNQRTLRYVFNDNVFDIAMYNIKRQKYKMAVSFSCPCTIQFISYIHSV